VAKKKKKSNKARMNFDKLKKSMIDTFGDENIFMLGDKKQTSKDGLPTGFFSFNLATGINGIPKGRITELYGAEGSGKTTLALSAIANMQANGGKVGYIDAECALDPVWAQKLGVNPTELLISQPEYGEMGLDIANRMISSGALAMVVVDSVAALTPKAELEGDFGDSNVGKHAKMIAQAMRVLTNITAKTGTSLVFLNQIRINLKKAMSGFGGDPTDTPGGNALKHFCSMRVGLRKMGNKLYTLSNSENAEGIGPKIHFHIVKNKRYIPYQKGNFIIPIRGYDKAFDIFYTAVELGVIEINGSWYSFDSENLGQGAEKAFEAFKNLKAPMRKELVSRLQEKY
jgi:recombination protein RecA